MFDPRDPFHSKTHDFHNVKEVIPVDCIECFFEIELENETSFRRFFHGVNDLVGNEDVVHYLPPLNKGRLGKADN